MSTKHQRLEIAAFELIRETSAAEQLVADAFAVDASIEDAARVRDCRDDFTFWGFPAEGLRRLGRTVGLHYVEIVDEVVVDGHPRIVALMRAAT